MGGNANFLKEMRLCHDKGKRRQKTHEGNSLRPPHQARGRPLHLPRCAARSAAAGRTRAATAVLRQAHRPLYDHQRAQRSLQRGLQVLRPIRAPQDGRRGIHISRTGRDHRQRTRQRGGGRQPLLHRDLGQGARGQGVRRRARLLPCHAQEAPYRPLRLARHFDARTVPCASRRGRHELPSQHRDVAPLLSRDLYLAHLR